MALSYTELMDLAEGAAEAAEDAEGRENAMYFLAKAQVYATMAVAAATYRGVNR